MTPSRPLVVANWKMGVAVTDARAWVHGFVQATTPTDRKHAIVLPSAVALSTVRLANRALYVGSQDCSAFADPAHTGSLSATDLKAMGCQYALVGHSERRRGNGETDAIIHAKIIQATAAGLIPILCIGEGALERKSGKTRFVISRQLRRALLPSPIKLHTLIVAYEPIWAIGSATPADAATITQTHQWIRGVLNRTPFADALLLYGGAVDVATIREICSLPNVDGVLVGRASWSAEKFAHLIAASALHH